jgi:hypothetical protein
MPALIIGLYGIYLLMVGVSGNAKALQQLAVADAPGFLPWAVSLGVIAVIYEIPETKRLAGPFLLLAAIAYVLRNFETLQTQFQTLYSMAQNAVTSNGASK